MVGMRKSHGIPQADEEFLESVAKGTDDLGTESSSSKALESIPAVDTKAADDSSEDTWEDDA